jgi:hypothetical protein
MRLREHRNCGLGLIEVLIIIATIGFLLVYLSMLNRQPGARASRINCVSNLKQLGLAMRMFANDHEDKFPWEVPLEKGGTLELPSNDPTPHFVAVSNELVTPKVLKCAEDRERTRSSGFAGLSRGNLSYFIGLEANISNVQSILAGDRNVTGGTVSNSVLVLNTSSSQVGWGKNLHNRAGNIGLADGSAQQVTESGMNKQLQSWRWSRVDWVTNETVRFIIP